MAVTGAERWYLAVLVLNKAFHVFTIERDEAEVQALIAAEKDFWENHVLKQIPPTPDGSESTSELLKQMFPEAKEREKTALFGYEDKIEQYLFLDAKVKELERERDRFKQELQLALGDAEIGQAQGYIVEWKNQVRQSLDTKKLKLEQIEIYEKYLKPAQTVRIFKIKEVS
jgi:predicted phage-related endonuclease